MLLAYYWHIGTAIGVKLSLPSIEIRKAFNALEDILTGLRVTTLLVSIFQ